MMFVRVGRRSVSTWRNSRVKFNDQSINWSRYGYYGAGFALAGGVASYMSWEMKSSCESARTSVDANVVSLDDDFKRRYENMIKGAQDRITAAIGEVDGRPFLHDDWERPEHGGGGRTRVLQEGRIFEKGGVNVSIVHGTIPVQAVKMMKAEHKSLSTLFEAGQEVKALPFYACGLSLVIHPRNPKAPTVHLNYRFFEVVNPQTGESSWWFGGGSDLTPSYLFVEDAVEFHQGLKKQCDKVDPTFFDDFKKRCDDYFVITHRGEARGIGGIFFDDLDHIGSSNAQSDPNGTKEKIMEFQKNCLDQFIETYVNIMNRRKDEEFTEEEKRWQQLRRGRYVEFNLVYDRGTKFGLYTPNARIESILMSLPLTCRFEYMHQPEIGSPEEEMLDVLKHPKDWIAVGENMQNISVALGDFTTDQIIEELVKRGVARVEVDNS